MNQHLMPTAAAQGCLPKISTILLHQLVKWKLLANSQHIPKVLSSEWKIESFQLCHEWTTQAHQYMITLEARRGGLHYFEWHMINCRNERSKWTCNFWGLKGVNKCKICQFATGKLSLYFAELLVIGVAHICTKGSSLWEKLEGFSFLL